MCSNVPVLRAVMHLMAGTLIRSTCKFPPMWATTSLQRQYHQRDAHGLTFCLAIVVRLGLLPAVASCQQTVKFCAPSGNSYHLLTFSCDQFCEFSFQIRHHQRGSDRCVFHLTSRDLVSRKRCSSDSRISRRLPILKLCRSPTAICK